MVSHLIFPQEAFHGFFVLLVSAIRQHEELLELLIVKVNVGNAVHQAVNCLREVVNLLIKIHLLLAFLVTSLLDAWRYHTNNLKLG